MTRIADRTSVVRFAINIILEQDGGFVTLKFLIGEQFPGAIYHIVTRGDGRRKLFRDPGHYERFTKGLEEEVQRSGWTVLAYCWMPNHIHALIQTPQPHLATGM